MELTSPAPPAAKSLFSIDSILQHNSALPPASQQRSPVWRNQVPEARFLQQQQQNKASLALQQHQQHHQLQGRNNQQLIQFILNARQPFHSILALGSSSIPMVASSNNRQRQSPNCALRSPVANNIVTSPCHCPTVAIPACTNVPPPPLIPRNHIERLVSAKQTRTASPPPSADLFSRRPDEPRQPDSVPGSPRRRQSSVNSVNSTGVSNDSDEDHDSVTRLSNGGECSFLPHFTNPNTKPARHTSSKDVGFKKSRTSFTKAQIHKLEVKFGEQKYLTKLDRIKLARDLGLTEKHIKTWFQNRRTKWKKDCSDLNWSKHKEMAATLMYSQYLESKHHNN